MHVEISLIENWRLGVGEWTECSWALFKTSVLENRKLRGLMDGFSLLQMWMLFDGVNCPDGLFLLHLHLVILKEQRLHCRDLLVEYSFCSFP